MKNLREGFNNFSKALSSLRPILGYFRRVWLALHKAASRRKMEFALLLVYVAWILRLLHAEGRLPALPVLAQTPVAAHLANAGDAFFKNVWPGTDIWIGLLIFAVLSSLAGLYQAYAACMVTHERGNPDVLTETGEDDPRYWESVDAKWLLIDIRLRRAGMLIGFYFFITVTYILAVHAGVWYALVTGVYVWGCSHVDDKLKDAQEKHENKRDEREQLAREALRFMAQGSRRASPAQD